MEQIFSMKVQIEGQKIRFRVDEAELKALLDGFEIVNTTRFEADTSFRLGLSLAVIPTACIESSPAGWQVRLPENLVHALVDRLPCKEGLSLSVPVGQDVELFVQFDVDVRDSALVRGKKRQPVGAVDR